MSLQVFVDKGDHSLQIPIFESLREGRNKFSYNNHNSKRNYTWVLHTIIGCSFPTSSELANLEIQSYFKGFVFPGQVLPHSNICSQTFKVLVMIDPSSQSCCKDNANPSEEWKPLMSSGIGSVFTLVSNTGHIPVTSALGCLSGRLEIQESLAYLEKPYVKRKKDIWRLLRQGACIACIYKDFTTNVFQ